MVKLNSDYIVKKVLKIFINDEEKQKIDPLKKVNHLCLCNRFIHKIDDLSPLINLAVLYLHENKISKIENFDRNFNLTHLYLQHNDIEKIENLSHLRNLKKLYLGHNKIMMVESLEGLDNLEELHIESQNLPPGETLYFDPRVVQALSYFSKLDKITDIMKMISRVNIVTTLRKLDISKNQIVTLDDIRELQALEELDASNNKISNLQATCQVVGFWMELRTLRLGGNPLTLIKKYPEKITAFTYKLSSLDGKVIKDETRKFLQNFEIAKVERKRAEQKQPSQCKFSSDIESLAEHLPPGIRNSISRSILKETVPSISKLTMPFQHIPAIKDSSLEKHKLVRSIKKNYNRQIPIKSLQEGKEQLQLM